MMIPRVRSTCLGLALLAIVVTGCDSKKMVKVNGRLLKDNQPMVVSEDTYVTISFVLDNPEEGKANSHSAKFDQKTGTYSVELPAGKYRTMVVIALPTKKDGKLNAPTKPVKSEQVHDLTKDQELDIEAPAK